MRIAHVDINNLLDPSYSEVLWDYCLEQDVIMPGDSLFIVDRLPWSPGSYSSSRSTDFSVCAHYILELGRHYHLSKRTSMSGRLFRARSIVSFDRDSWNGTGRSTGIFQ